MGLLTRFCMASEKHSNKVFACTSGTGESEAVRLVAGFKIFLGESEGLNAWGKFEWLRQVTLVSSAFGGGDAVGAVAVWTAGVMDFWRPAFAPRST